MDIIKYISVSLLGLYLLWILFLAVMNLLRVKNEGKLCSTALYLGIPVLFLGLVLDFLVNVFVLTPILMELPKETTVTARLKRHNKESSGWCKAVAVWTEPLLDPFDPSGDHI